MFNFLSFRQIKKHRKATEKKKRKPWITQYILKVRSPETGKIFATITLEAEEKK